jgi:hypothetical protein
MATQKIETLLTMLAKKVDLNKINDMRFIDMLADFAENENPVAITKIINLMVSPEDKEKLYKALERPDGTVPPDAVSDAVLSIMKRCRELKNS